MLRLAALLLSTSSLLAVDFPTPYNTEKGQPMPAEEAAASMKLPLGFTCQVFASEPAVQQPISMAWDTQGRLWIAECYTYAENPQRWDTNLRDRIILFEDKDNDGRHDGRKVFYDQATYLTSVEVGHGGVWMLAEGGLSFIPDKNADDVPDGPPELLLDGFNTKTIGHNIVNGLRWGPDGWLYGRHGITDTSAIGAPGTPLEKRTRMNCGIWRFHPKTRVFEPVLHGGTNSWGHDWDAQGEMFWINTVIGHLFHGVPGAYNDRMFGAHLNPHVYETIPQAADHYHFDIGNEKWSDIRNGISSKTLELGGGHAHVGCMIYNGGHWPQQYVGKVFTCNLHGNRINVERLEPQGCGFVGKHEPDFMQAADKWFRGIELSAGPDGNVFVLDWSDSGECHDNDGVHRTSGRIYKIVHGGQTQRPKQWEERMAWQKREDQTDRMKQADQTDLGRLHQASALQRMPLAERWAVATALAAHAEDAADKQQPLMIWYGIEPAVAADPAKGVELVKAAKLPTLRRLITRRIAEDYEKNFSQVNELVSYAVEQDAVRQDVVQGIAAALKGLATAQKPMRWEELMKVATDTTPALLSSMQDLNLLFGSGRAAEELLVLVKDTEGDASARRSAFASLMRAPKTELFSTVRGLINDKVLGTVARLALAKFGDQDVPKVLLANAWPERSIEWRAANIETLSSRPAWAKALLQRMEQNAVMRKDLTAAQARQLRTLKDAELDAMLSKIWGETRDTPEAKKQEITAWKGKLTTEALAKGNAVAGEAIFTAACASCHKLKGKGAAIAPDLTGSDRRNLDYLLGNIVDPSAVVPADYRVTLVKLKDGRSLAGVIPEQSERTLTLQTPAERMTLERSAIEKIEPQSSSFMPEGLLQGLGEQNVLHLFRYMME